MAVDHQTTPKPDIATTFQTHHHHPRRRIFFLRRQKNKLPTVRLGGKKQRGRVYLVKVLKKKIKWVKLQYTCMLRKLKKHYRNLIKDLVEASASVEAFQQRMFMESSFAVPVMGVSLSTFPASDRPKTLLF
ncbi:Subtilase family protein [Hibiscus syriacus]|uniref:Subtilase family protein n=1 Tax=Hibiscus syriacus TaxID=106335 RepID=A0A6A2WYJ2_HIBSY|nr:Subtilase family protein [Hibiscus syriacus]